MRAWIGLAALLVCLSTTRAEEDYAALLQQAVAAIDWQFSESWAYTETAYKDGEIWIGRFDPRIEEDPGWTLLSVDGKAPTSRQQRDYLHDKEEHDSVLTKTISG